MRSIQLIRIRLSLAAAVCLIGFTAMPTSAFTVYDPANAVLNAQQVAKQAEEIAQTIKQIKNQIQSLQNQAKMLANLDFSNYEQAVTSMRRIRDVLRRNCAEMIPAPNRIGFDTGFDCRQLMQRFRKTYPAPKGWPKQTHSQIARYPDQWNAQKREAAAKAVQMQNASVAAMQGTSQRMEQLASASKKAPGQKAAQQVTNEMLVTLSSQLRGGQAATLALQRALALKQARQAAWYERNQEIVRRLTRDSHVKYTVHPIHDPFTRMLP